MNKFDGSKHAMLKKTCILSTDRWWWHLWCTRLHAFLSLHSGLFPQFRVWYWASCAATTDECHHVVHGRLGCVWPHSKAGKLLPWPLWPEWETRYQQPIQGSQRKTLPSIRSHSAIGLPPGSEGGASGVFQCWRQSGQRESAYDHFAYAVASGTQSDCRGIETH